MFRLGFVRPVGRKGKADEEGLRIQGGGNTPALPLRLTESFLYLPNLSSKEKSLMDKAEGASTVT